MTDRLPQARVLRELRSALDELRPPHAAHPPFFVSPKAQQKRALGRIEKLVAENPRAVRSVHVRYNLGARRVEMLDALERHFAAGHSDQAARSDGDGRNGE